MRKTLIMFGFSLLMSGVAQSSQPTQVKAFYREGQTFLTWKEDGSVKGEWYKVYASNKPITDVARAQLVARVPEDSRTIRWTRDVTSVVKSLRNPKYLEAVQLEDDIDSGKILPPGTGVFVRTIKQAADTYYAVTIELDGKEDTVLKAGSNALQSAVTEKVETPGAILVGRGISKSDAKSCFVYLFFTDFERWNPDKTDDNWEGYAHILQVGVPKDADGKTRMPLTVRLHHWGSGVSLWRNMKIPNGRVELALLDYHRTWWFGYSDSQRLTDEKTKTPPKGVIHNFTEQRVMQAVAWLTKGPPNCKAHVDPKAVSVQGHSMGGSGVNVFGARHGDLFAAGHASKGMTNWGVSPKINSKWYKDIQPKFGPYTRNDKTNEGMPVYEQLNMPKWLGAHSEIDTPFLDMANGITDFVIVFHTTPDYWRGLEKGKHPYAAAWRTVDHSGMISSGTPMNYQLLRLNEPLPAFANASSNHVIRSGFRARGNIAKKNAKTITVSDNKNMRGRSPKDFDFTGKTLIIAGGKWKIAGNDGMTITIEDGDLTAHKAPPPSKRKLRSFRLKKGRKPTQEEVEAWAAEAMKTYLVVDGELQGQWNGYFAWSSHYQNFSKQSKTDDIVDEEKRFGINMAIRRNKYFGEYKEDTATADITPRRCQKFKPRAGSTVKWENISFENPAKPEKIAEGTVTADKHGLVTVPKFQIGKKGWGNRLVLTVE